MNQCGATYEGMNRIAYRESAPDTYRALLALEGTVRKSGLERRLVELVYLQVSQINGCAFCIDMHGKDLRAAGETPERIALLLVWREAPCFGDRERAAFAFAEALTLLEREGVPDDVYEAALATFGAAQLAELALAVATINAWNRMSIAFRAVPGAYQATPR